MPTPSAVAATGRAAQAAILNQGNRLRFAGFSTMQAHKRQRLQKMFAAMDKFHDTNEQIKEEKDAKDLSHAMQATLATGDPAALEAAGKSMRTRAGAEGFMDVALKVRGDQRAAERLRVQDARADDRLRIAKDANTRAEQEHQQDQAAFQAEQAVDDAFANAPFPLDTPEDFRIARELGFGQGLDENLLNEKMVARLKETAPQRKLDRELEGRMAFLRANPKLFAKYGHLDRDQVLGLPSSIFKEPTPEKPPKPPDPGKFDAKTTSLLSAWSRRITELDREIAAQNANVVKNAGVNLELRNKKIESAALKEATNRLSGQNRFLDPLGAFPAPSGLANRAREMVDTLVGEQAEGVPQDVVQEVAAETQAEAANALEELKRRGIFK